MQQIRVCYNDQFGTSCLTRQLYNQVRAYSRWFTRRYCNSGNFFVHADSGLITLLETLFDERFISHLT